MKRLIDYSSRFRILKGGKISLVVTALLGSATLSFAAPSGGVVTSGSATINQNGTITNINQSTNKASINWQNFSIGTNETVNFNQPSVSSITLNRVIGNESSVIDGAMNANGQVWILNSNGVLFGKTASINTSGILATTAKLSDTDFQNGNYNFTDATSNSVINEGTIEVINNGSVILASNEVRNDGAIKAIRGKVHLVGAKDYSLNLNGNSLVNLKVDKGVLDAMVENSGTIIADGGEIYLTTNAVDELLKGMVNNTGIIEANSLDGLTGYVEVFAHGGTATIDGTIEAEGGFVETSGKDLSVKSTAQIKTAHWLLDPDDIIISSTGEDDLSGAAINATAIQNALLNADVEILAGQESGEDITVNENITWATTKKLTLTAGEVYVNAIIQNTNTTDGGVYFNATNQVIFDSNGKVIVNNASQLQWTSTARAGNYELGNDINLAGIFWTPYWFTGNFDGLAHTISNLTINKPTEDYIGLFSRNNGTIKNIGLINVDITGRMHVGSIVADNRGTITNVYSTGQVEGIMSYVGGLVSENFGDIEDSYSFVNVQGSSLSVGGLVGQNGGGNIKRSFATGNVIASNANYVGGLVGLNQANIEDSFALGEVTGQDAVGGFVGQQASTGTISTSYSTGKVTGNSGVGGFLGINFEYNNNGNYGTVSNSYWDSDSSEQSVGIGTSNSSGIIQTVTAVKSSTETVNAFNEATYSGFDFTNDWYIIEGSIRPLLRNMYSTNITNAYQLQLMELDPTADYTLANDINFNILYTGDGGVQKANASGIWNTATGFNPISELTGTFDGQNHDITNLVIIRPDTDYVGLFSKIAAGGKVSNIQTFSAYHFVGGNYSGIVAGSNEGTIENIKNAGGSVRSVGDKEALGGLVGINKVGGVISNSGGTMMAGSSGSSKTGSIAGINSGTITKSFSAIQYTTQSTITGGLVGENTATGVIEDSFTNGSIQGTTDTIGGLVGANYGTIINSRSGFLREDGTVEGSGIGSETDGGNMIGGLVGYNEGEVSYSYAVHDVFGYEYIGGLVGKNNEGTITNSYSIGGVNGSISVGGLVGNNTNSIIENSYFAGEVSSSLDTAGGLIGSVSGIESEFINSYYDKTLNPNVSDPGETGKTTTELQSIATFTTDITDEAKRWDITEDDTLSSTYKYPVIVTENGVTSWKIYSELAPTPPTNPTPEQQIEQIADIVTPIVNGTRTMVNAPQIRAPQVQTPTPRTQTVPNNLGLGVNARIVSTADLGEQADQVVSLGELQQTGGEIVRVPLSKNSIVDLVNGGVNLPEGVEQQFFVVADEN